MCKIFVCPSKEMKFSKEDIHGFFELLEAFGGKDGNGLYLIDNQQLHKSVDIMPTWMEIDNRFIFHTRYATHGLVRDYNCQPFNGYRYVICHNGVFSDYEMLGRYMNTRSKYSDSYVIHKLIEERGLFNFYNAFNEESFGVVIAYDKMSDTIYMIKTGKSDFEHAKMCGINVYGTSDLDYWDLDDKPKKFGKGMYILKPNEIIKIHQPTNRYTYHGDYYNDYYGDYYDHTVNNIKTRPKTKNWNNLKGKNKKMGWWNDGTWY